MTKKKTDLSPKRRIATLENRIAAKISPKSKVENESGKMVGSVTVRYKELANGSLRLYLDTYKDGKRKCYFLKTLDPAKVVSIDDAGEENETAISEAEAKRIAFANDMRAGNDNKKKAALYAKVLLTDWIAEYVRMERKGGKGISESRKGTIKNLVKHLEAYNKGMKVTLGDIDKEYCEGFLLHIASTKPTRGSKPLSNNTQAQYFKTLRAILQMAVDEGKLERNPTKQVRKNLIPEESNSKRAYLEIEELKAMIAAPCRHEQVKMAYLFGCFCGLRLSDISALTWADIKTANGQKWIEIKMQKTQADVKIPISAEAEKWLPKQSGKQRDKIFRLPTKVTINTCVRDWANEAGVTKHLSFHTSRHTFATVALGAGADIYTTSKLLGHTSVRTTEIYAKIVDKKKAEAVNLVSNLFND